MATGEVLNVEGHASDVSLHIVDRPFVATIRCTIAGRKHTLSLTNPGRLSASDDPGALEVLTWIFGEFYGFVVIDRNVNEPNCLEFGRYLVQLQTYDGGMGVDFAVDKYDHSVTEAPTTA